MIITCTYLSMCYFHQSEESKWPWRWTGCCWTPWKTLWVGSHFFTFIFAFIQVIRKQVFKMQPCSINRRAEIPNISAKHLLAFWDHPDLASSQFQFSLLRLGRPHSLANTCKKSMVAPKYSEAFNNEIGRRETARTWTERPVLIRPLHVKAGVHHFQEPARVN